MKRAFFGSKASLVLALAMGIVSLSAMAQNRGRPRARITDLKFRTVRTPQFRDTSNTAASSQRQWVQAYVEYETSGGRDGWMDELSIRWTVLMRPERGRPMIFHRTVDYVGVEDGNKHHAVVYLRPGFVMRHTEQRNPSKGSFSVYVEIYSRGERLAREEFSRSRLPRNWWRAKEPEVKTVENELYPRNRTPFAAMDYDFYEQIKWNGQ